KGNKELETESNPAIMLDDDCIMKKDLPLSLIRRVKEFASLANIKSVFNNEGFVDISIRFMGELWIMKVFWIRAKEVPGLVSEFMEESDDESIFEEEMPDMEGGRPENNVFGESSDPDAIAETVFTESV
nr:nucleotide-binding alpha-beta plait domain-containing protein [Tanacetum cinerariifolium]